MNLFSLIGESVSSAFSRKKTLAVFGVLLVIGAVLGLIFVTTPSSYEYALDLCDRYIDLVVYSDRSVFLIFLERTAGRTLLLLLVALSGVHRAGCFLPPAVLTYRSYTLGGSLYVFFSVYKFSGALVVLLLYLPVHLIVDGVLLLATAQAYGRAPRFCFRGGDFLLLLKDTLCLFVLILAACLLETVLLLVLFHPIGNIL